MAKKKEKKKLPNKMTVNVVWFIGKGKKSRSLVIPTTVQFSKVFVSYYNNETPGQAAIWAATSAVACMDTRFNVVPSDAKALKKAFAAWHKQKGG